MKKVLLIEDNESIRENTAEILTLANYNVLTAANGKEGVEIALKEMPDIIVCDIMMPVLDGYGVLHLLSKNDETSSIPFIFLTAKAEHIDFRKGMDMGADDYLTKPFDDIELLNAIEIRLKKNEMLKTQFAYNITAVNNFINQAKGIDSLKKLSEEREVRFYKKKDDIYKEGSYPKGVYFIAKGKVKTYRTNEFGKDLISALYNEGEFFGYATLLQNEKYTDTATALEDAEIYMIPKEDFFDLIYKNPEVSKKFIEMLSNDVHDTQKKLIHLAYDSVRKRVAEALVQLSNKYKKEGDLQFSINIGREDLSNLVGTATETVIRALTDFKKDKLIKMIGSTITVLNYQKLLEMKN